jgi:poly-gamma-glutamate capsule biosynthesis protein CapA/YwtB (metallophosphatase superfamily)
VISIRSIEPYRERLILYGCGDLVGKLAELRLAAMRMRKFRLQRASDEDAEWLAAVLRRESALRVQLTADARLLVG